MTLRQVADGTGLPLTKLIRGLELPPDTSPETPLHQLAAEYGVRMRDVRRVIREGEDSPSPDRFGRRAASVSVRPWRPAPWIAFANSSPEFADHRGNSWRVDGTNRPPTKGPQ
jgi:hypothetical protein